MARSPDERDRDLEDLGHILADYLAADDMRRWDDPRLAEVPDFEHQPALALGLDIAQLRHRQLVESFLEAVDQPDSIAFERLARASSPGAEPQRAFRLRLDAFRAGLSARQCLTGSDVSAVAAETLLRAAYARYGSRLGVDGDEAFRSRLLGAAVSSGLPITFADQQLERRRAELQQRETAIRDVGFHQARTTVPGRPGRARTMR